MVCPFPRTFKRRAKSSTTGRTVLLSLIHSKSWKEAILRAKALPLEVSEWYVERYEDVRNNYNNGHKNMQNQGQANSSKAGDSYSAHTTATNALNELQLCSQSQMILERLLPLHLACELNAPFDLIAVLLDVYPEAALMHEYGSGNTPLHLACTSPVDVSFTDDYPARVSASTVKTGEHSEQAKTLQLLLNYHPKAIGVTNKTGQLPIHLACEGNLDHSVIFVLINAWEVQNKDGTERKYPGLKGSDSCLAMKDRNGNIPLHLLCQSVTIQRDTLSLLLSRAPYTASIKNYEQKTAADIVGEGWGANKLAMLDLLKKNSIYWKLNNFGSTNSHVNDDVEITTKSDLHKLIDRLSGFDDISTSNSIVNHLKSHPEEAKIFYCMKDGDGTTWRRFLPIHLAIEKCAHADTINALLTAYPG